MSETADTVETPYGRLDQAALTSARESYDTAALRTVGELDECIATIQGEDGGLRSYCCAFTPWHTR